MRMRRVVIGSSRPFACRDVYRSTGSFGRGKASPGLRASARGPSGACTERLTPGALRAAEPVRQESIASDALCQRNVVFAVLLLRFKST
jgi:hypothetical protein